MTGYGTFLPFAALTITAAVGGRADQSRASSNDVNDPISDTEDIRSNVLSSVPFRSPHADGEGMVASFRPSAETLVNRRLHAREPTAQARSHFGRRRRWL